MSKSTSTFVVGVGTGIVLYYLYQQFRASKG